MNEQRLARTFVQLADTLVDEFDVVEFLQLLVDRAWSCWRSPQPG